MRSTSLLSNPFFSRTTNIQQQRLTSGSFFVDYGYVSGNFLFYDSINNTGTNIFNGKKATLIIIDPNRSSFIFALVTNITDSTITEAVIENYNYFLKINNKEISVEPSIEEVSSEQIQQLEQLTYETALANSREGSESDNLNYLAFFGKHLFTEPGFYIIFNTDLGRVEEAIPREEYETLLQSHPVQIFREPKTGGARSLQGKIDISTFLDPRYGGSGGSGGSRRKRYWFFSCASSCLSV